MFLKVVIHFENKSEKKKCKAVLIILLNFSSQ